MGRIHNIEGRKNKQDSKRAAVFTKYARLITVAVKEGGPDPEYNASLKTAIEKAKAMNMPNDNIEKKEQVQEIQKTLKVLYTKVMVPVELL